MSSGPLIMEAKNKETHMNPTRMTYGTISIEWDNNHTLTLGVAVPYFLAERLHGKITPPQWDEAVGNFILRDKVDILEWSGRFNFPTFNEELTKKGRSRREGVGGLHPWPGVDQGKAKPAVSGTRRVWVNGRGVRELSIRRGVQALSAVKAGNMARKGYTGLSKRKDTKRVVPKKRIKALAGVAVG